MFHARKSSNNHMLCLPSMDVETYLSLCETAGSSTLDFCRCVIDYFPDTPEFEEMDVMDAFYLLLSSRIHYVSDEIRLSVDKSTISVKLGDWFERAKDIVFGSTPRTILIEDDGIEAVIEVPRFRRIYRFLKWYSENTDLESDELKRDINRDFLTTACFVKSVTVDGGEPSSSFEEIVEFINVVPNNFFEMMRATIEDLDLNFGVILSLLPNGASPLMVSPINAVEVARMLFTENPEGIVEMLYIIGKNVHFDARKLTRYQVEHMMELLNNDLRARNNALGASE